MEVIQDIATLATHFWGLAGCWSSSWVLWFGSIGRQTGSVFDRDAMMPFINEEQEEGSHGRSS